MPNYQSSKEFGADGGHKFEDMLEFNPKVWGPITTLIIQHGSRIIGITVLYAGGQSFTYGGRGGTQSKITLRKGEYINKVAGRSGKRVDQLRFKTNKGQSFKFGGGGGKDFEVDLGGDSLVGLVGRANDEVDKIGFLFAKPVKFKAARVYRSRNYGAGGGHAFDDMATGGTLLGRITKIHVRCGSRIKSVGFHYKNHGLITHGGTGGSEEKTFTLNPDEYIVKVTGRYGKRVDQLKFYLNTGRASPTYGGSGGTHPFTCRMKNKVLTGLFGRSNQELDNIGFYFSDDPPVSMVFTKLDLDMGNVERVQTAPRFVGKVKIENKDKTEQVITQTEKKIVTNSSTTSCTKSWTYGLSFTVSKEFTFCTAEFTASFEHTSSYTFGESHSETSERSCEMQVKVQGESRIEASLFAKSANVTVPWTGVATVTHRSGVISVEKLKGYYQGVHVETVEAKYGPATPILKRGDRVISTSKTDKRKGQEGTLVGDLDISTDKWVVKWKSDGVEKPYSVSELRKAYNNEVVVWLEGYNLGKLLSVFEDAHCESIEDILSLTTDEMKEELKIPLFSRKRLTKAIEAHKDKTLKRGDRKKVLGV